MKYSIARDLADRSAPCPLAGVLPSLFCFGDETHHVRACNQIKEDRILKAFEVCSYSRGAMRVTE